MSTDPFRAGVVPVFGRGLRNLAGFLPVGVDALTAGGRSETDVLSSRLAPDMLPLSRQVQIATDHAKGACARLADVEMPRIADDETRLDQLLQRIERVRDFIGSIPAESFVGAAERHISLKMGASELSFTGTSYAYTFALPNFYFHLTAAYAILRHLGAPLGKRDFLGARDATS